MTTERLNEGAQKQLDEQVYNDLIEPAGTYYQQAVQQAIGDIATCIEEIAEDLHRDFPALGMEMQRAVLLRHFASWYESRFARLFVRKDITQRCAEIKAEIEAICDASLQGIPNSYAQTGPALRDIQTFFASGKEHRGNAAGMEGYEEPLPSAEG